MSNILNVSATSPFSAPTLDTTGSQQEELDPRFIEELQGAMGQQSAEPSPPTTGSEQASADLDESEPNATNALQNLPLMPWVSMAVPANFALSDPVLNGSTEQAVALDSVAGVAATQTLPLSSVDALASTTTAALEPTQLASGDAGAVKTSSPAAAGTVSTRQIVSQTVAPDVLEESRPLKPMSTASATNPGALSPSEEIHAVAHQRVSSVTQSTVDESLPQASLSMPSSRAVVDEVLMTREASSTAALEQKMPGVDSSQIVQPAVAEAMQVESSVVFAVPVPSSAISPQVLASGEPINGLNAHQIEQLTAVSRPDGQDASEWGQVAAKTPSESGTPLSLDRPTVFDSTSTSAMQSSASSPAMSDGVKTALAGADRPELSLPQMQTATPLDVATDVTASSLPIALETMMQASAQRDDADTIAERASQDVMVALDSAGSTSTPRSADLTHMSVSDTVVRASDTHPETRSDTLPVTSTAMAQMARPDSVIDQREDNALSRDVTRDDSMTRATPDPLSNAVVAIPAEPAAQDSLPAESTFASSFVQALMGQVHHATAHQAQPLEVIPAPAPMSPHQVRLDAGQVQVEVVRLVKQGGGQVVMELTPPDESKFKIDLSISHQGIARLVVDGASESTRLRLEQTVSGLQDQFQQMGLQLQLDMRQPHQQEARSPSTPSFQGSADRDNRVSRSVGIDPQPVTGRPTWDQGQVYLVA